MRYIADMKKSLLEKVQEARKLPDADNAAVAVEWALGHLTFTDIQRGVGKTAGSGVYAKLARGLRDAVRLGLLRKAA